MMTDFYIASLVLSLMAFLFHTRVHSLPKKAPAFTKLFNTSLSTLQVEVSVLPRYVKLSTLFNVVFSISTVGAGEGKGCYSLLQQGKGCSITSVFHKLIVGIQALAAIKRQLASSYRSGSFRM